MQSAVLARVAALTSDSISASALDGFWFKAKADNSGQNGWKEIIVSLLHPSTADNKVLKVGNEIKFTALATGVALSQCLGTVEALVYQKL